MITYIKQTIIIAMALVFNAAPMAFALQDAANPVPGQTVIVALSSGDAIRATLVSETGDSIVLLHPVLGKVTLPRASIASMVATAAPAAAPAAATDDSMLRQEAQPAANAVMDAPRPQDGVNLADDVAAKGAVPAPAAPPSPWKFVLDANVNYVNAANNQLDFRAAAEAIDDVADLLDDDSSILEKSFEIFGRQFNSDEEKK